VGSPLSQAASSKAFLFGQLHGSSDALARSTLYELEDRQPSIVIEEVEDGVAGRRLISPYELRAIPQFWTLESRSADSLGALSRDLGRELSLHQFMLALAPDLIQASYSPMLPEGHRHVWDVCAVHSPILIEFSREHQQTAVKWTPVGDREPLSLDLDEVADIREVIELIEQEENRSLSTRFAVYSARLVGDDPEAEAVNSRLGLILKPASGLEAAWAALRRLLLSVIADPRSREFRNSLVVATGFFEHFRRSERTLYRSSRYIDLRTLDNAIRLISEGTLQRASAETLKGLPDLLNKCRWFDASSSWLDWDRPNR
jgi:hypothetical protein